jgi:pimeloyl-ACP methyl ester carboxylesterase
VWRTRGLGELSMALFGARAMRVLGELTRSGRRPIPEAWVSEWTARLDPGTKRAILRLYRSGGPAALAAEGADLGRLECPALVLWGAHDPYVGIEQGHWYARALPDAQLRVFDDGGHWVLREEPTAVEAAVAHLGS